MTAQIPERLRYEGNELALCTHPLAQFFAFGGDCPPLSYDCTALWRGYVGRWEIIDGRLYLVGLEGRCEDGSVLTMERLFPGFSRRVFAHWYSGTLRVPRGRQLRYVHMGYGSVHEADLFLDLDHGVLRGTHITHNGTAADGSPAGFGPAGMVLFDRDDREPG